MEGVTWPKTCNIHLHHAAFYCRRKLVLYNVPVSPSLPHDTQIKHRQKLMLDLGINKQSFSSSTTTTTILHNALVTATIVLPPPPSFHDHHCHHCQWPPLASVAHAHNHRMRRMEAFAGAMSLSAMWQPNDERLLFGE